MKKTRIIFMGTGNFAAPSLQTLIDDARYDVIAVYTQPERNSGRGRKKIIKNPVRTIADTHKIPLYNPHEKLSSDTILTSLQELAPDLIVVASYGKILPPSILDLPPHGCLNLHASLLPRWRGATPVHSAIRAGDTMTGVTLMQMDAGLDTGAIIAQSKREISNDTHTPALLDMLARDAASLLSTTLHAYLARELTPQKQSTDGITLCRTLIRDDGHIDWNSDAKCIYDHFRAYDPWPGVFTLWRRDDTTLRLKISDLSYCKEDINSPAGTVIYENGIFSVATGHGTIILHTIQPEGKRIMSIKDFTNGAHGFCNSVLL